LRAEESEVRNIKYIVRGKHKRSNVKGEKIKEELEEQKPSGRIRFSIKKGKKQRKVEQEIWYKEVELRQPPRKKGLPEVKMVVVLARETEESAGSEKPIEWMLLTNKKIDNGREAIEILDYYLSSSQRGFHPKALTKPDMRLSPHPAFINQSTSVRISPSVQINSDSFS